MGIDTGLPLTKCGNPYGGCALCDPEQFAQAQRERDEIQRQKMIATRRQHQAGRLSHHLGDYYRTCPPEFSKSASKATAKSMLERYGALIAFKRARRHALNQAPESWAEKHWVLVAKYLRLAALSAD